MSSPDAQGPKNESAFMGFFAIAIGVICLIASFMYIIIMGPTRYHKDGFIGRLYVIITSVPSVVGGCCCSVFYKGNQRKGREKWKRVSHKCVRERNIFMVLFYIIIVWTAEYFYLFVSLPQLKASYLSKFTSWGLVLLSELFWLLSCFVDPGIVTRKNDLEQQKLQFLSKGKSEGKDVKNRKAKKGTHNNNNNSDPKPTKKFSFSPEDEYILNRRYIVDGIVHALNGDSALEEELSEEELEYCSPEYKHKVGFGQSCTTCHVYRPARSRHCRMCNNCVRRYDHHCPWINGDVAEGNHRYFLLFLFCHAISCTYSTIDSYRLIKQFLLQNNAWGWRMVRRGRVFQLRFFDYLAIIVTHHLVTGVLIFFTFFIGLVLYGFLTYQLSFVVKNLTMNEYCKIEDSAIFVTELPSLDLVYREAMRVRERLQRIGARKPKALLALEEPPLPLTVRGYEEGGRKNKLYRRKVKKMIISDLKGLYDRGIWNNFKEVFFPYSILREKRSPENV